MKFALALIKSREWSARSAVTLPESVTDNKFCRIGKPVVPHRREFAGGSNFKSIVVDLFAIRAECNTVRSCDRVWSDRRSYITDNTSLATLAHDKTFVFLPIISTPTYSSFTKRDRYIVVPAALLFSFPGAFKFHLGAGFFFFFFF